MTGAVARRAASVVMASVIGLASLNASYAQSTGNFTTLSASGTATFSGDVLACSGRPWLDVRCPLTLFPPPQPSLSSVAGGLIAAATYSVKVTYVNASGETAGSAETSLAVAASSLLSVSSPPAYLDATGWNVYVATASGSETKQNSSPIAIGTAWTEPASGLAAGSTPPAASTASVPQAVGDDTADDTDAVQLAIETAASKGWPLYLSAGTYKVSSGLVLDYASTARTGFRLISAGATIDGTTVSGAPVLLVECSGGSVSSPATCFYFRQSGTLFIKANESGYAFQFGKADFSDQHNSMRVDHLVVDNASTAASAGACQFNAIYDSTIDAVCDSAGGGIGLALEEVQFSRIMGAGSAAGTGGRAMALENGYNLSNTIEAMDLEVAPTCLSITSPYGGQNTFLSPYFNCNTAVDATAGYRNLLVNPLYAGLVVNRGPQAVGISVSYTGNWLPWQFPSVSSYTATGIDDNTAISSYNAPGSVMTVTLPAPSSINPGWKMGFATDNGKGMTIDAPSGYILSGGVQLSSLVLGPGNYEYAELESDGSNFRVISATRNTRLYNGLESSPFPSRWLYPSASGYAAGIADDGEVFSSYNASLSAPATPSLSQSAGGTLAATAYYVEVTYVNADGETLPSGEASLAVSANDLLLASVASNAYATGWNIYVGTSSGGEVKQNSSPIPIGSAWTEPATGLVSGSPPPSGNTSGGLTVTLPATSGLPSGWSIGLASDNGNPLTVQVSTGGAGGHILFPGSGALLDHVALANSNASGYEFATVQYDGSGNFRLLQETPATAEAIGEIGAAALARWVFPAVSAYAAAQSDNGTVISSYNSPLSYLTVTLPPTTQIAAGWKIAIASDNEKAASVQVNSANGGEILFPGAGSGVSSFSLAGNNYEFAEFQFDGSNFRLVSASPQSAAENGVLGAGGGISRWSFPTTNNYAASASDNGNAVSSYNTAGGLTVTLPARTTLSPGWIMGFATDNGNPLTIDTHAGGKHLLEPARGGVSTSSLALAAGQNYEFVALEYDGSNFRMVEASPQTVNALGGLITAGTPADNAQCNTGQLEFDSNYLYLCTAPNTWKRAAWSAY